MSQRFSRRKFLTETLFGALVLSATKLLPFGLARAEATSETQPILKFFSPNEFLIMQAVAERIVGAAERNSPTASDVNVALRADQFLLNADPEVQDQFHQLLTVFNGVLFAFLFEFHQHACRGARFVPRKLDDKLARLPPNGVSSIEACQPEHVLYRQSLLG